MRILTAVAVLALIVGCSDTDTEEPVLTSNSYELEFEQYQLDNGLNVILHRDTSDPIVAVATLIHVGSSREEIGRTGFAHLFEHMAFNDSENVPRGANRVMVEQLGGMRNGGTWSDGTIYYEVVPKDALEKVMWIDSDRLGYMINTVTESALEREKQVVKNEKRQRVDNQAYGHTGAIIRRALYPEGHPYSWTVIGELEDLQAATLEDVRAFYDRYYGPSNATLVVAGDIDIEETKAMIERWFGEIAPGQEVADMAPMPVTLDEPVSLYHHDNFAQLPELTITIPTVEEYHPDSYALGALGFLLSDGKRAPLYRHIVEVDRLAPGVSASQSSSELAGEFVIRVRANEGQSLDEVLASVERALDDFEQNGFADADLERMRASLETSFHQSMMTVLGKSFQLATYAEFAGDAGFYKEYLEQIAAVERADIERVFQKYIRNANAVYTSVVPKEQPELVLSNAVDAGIVEEQIVVGAETVFDDEEGEYERTPTVHDRSEPPLGEPALVTPPVVERQETSNGIEILHIGVDDTPLFNFSLMIPGGTWLEAPQQYGINQLMASLLNEGTANKTPAELEDAIGRLGSQLSFAASRDGIALSGSGLATNYEQTLALAAEMLLEPRFDEAEFERIKQRTLMSIRASETRPMSIAARAMYRQLYGEGHRVAYPLIGLASTIESITLDDVKTFHREVVAPQGAKFAITGDMRGQVDHWDIFEFYFGGWENEQARDLIITNSTHEPTASWVFVDLPGAKQSVLMAAAKGPSDYSEDRSALSTALFQLGGGSSAQLFQTLRIQLGYTYGAYSQVSGGHFNGPVLAYSSVRANVTSDAMAVFKGLIEDYATNYSEEDLATTQRLLIRADARAFESLQQKTSMLRAMAAFGLPDNYVELKQQRINNMTVEEVKSLTNQYLPAQGVTYIVVGDGESQLEGLIDLLGDPLIVDYYGNVIN